MWHEKAQHSQSRCRWEEKLWLCVCRCIVCVCFPGEQLLSFGCNGCGGEHTEQLYWENPEIVRGRAWHLSRQKTDEQQKHQRELRTNSNRNVLEELFVNAPNYDSFKRHSKMTHRWISSNIQISSVSLICRGRIQSIKWEWYFWIDSLLLMWVYWALVVITRATDHQHANSLITRKVPWDCGTV